MNLKSEFQESAVNPERVLLVIVDPPDSREAEANAEELALLCESAALQITDSLRIPHRDPDPRYYIGKGNAEHAFQLVQDTAADLIVAGVDLSPTQQRNLEDAITVRVVDRTQLILDIFAQRARTSEGKLQVELAQYRYLLPRLAGRGKAMSQIGGGSAGGVATRGPGETRLETDRRRVRKRISVLQDRLEEVVKHREIQNRARRRLMIPSAALVGYTSAGKSTLLNLLAGTEVEANARLFATLDPTTRRVSLQDGRVIILSDTVGFLRNLPHHLIAAFRATLEEVVEADFLIHVVDAHHHFFNEQRAAVLEVLDELGASGKPLITVYNKSDLINDQYELRKLIAENPLSCYMSALTGEGRQYLELLISRVIENLMPRVEAVLPYGRGDLLALAHDRGRVIQQAYREDGIYVLMEIPPNLLCRFSAYVTPQE